jgi:hypothetical protein
MKFLRFDTTGLYEEKSFATNWLFIMETCGGGFLQCHMLHTSSHGGKFLFLQTYNFLWWKLSLVKFFWIIYCISPFVMEIWWWPTKVQGKLTVAAKSLQILEYTSNFLVESKIWMELKKRFRDKKILSQREGRICNCLLQRNISTC